MKKIADIRPPEFIPAANGSNFAGSVEPISLGVCRISLEPQARISLPPPLRVNTLRWFSVGLRSIVVTMPLRALSRFFVCDRGFRCCRSSTTRLLSVALPGLNFRGHPPASGLYIWQPIWAAEFITAAKGSNFAGSTEPISLYSKLRVNTSTPFFCRPPQHRGHDAAPGSITFMHRDRGLRC